MSRFLIICLSAALACGWTAPERAAAQQKQPAAQPPQQEAEPPPEAEEPPPAPQVEKRVEKLEKKVEKMDKRVTKLEKGGAAAPAPSPAPPGKEQPLTATLVGKKQVSKDGTFGLTLTVEFRNMLNYTINNGFSGTLVFKAEGRKGVYTRRVAYSRPLAPGETAKMELYISSDDAKQYLKFVKAKTVNLAFVNQQLSE